MRPAASFLLVVALVASACHSRPTTADSPEAHGSPVAETTREMPADSLFIVVLSRLERRHYAILQRDSVRHRLEVRAPGDSTRVEVRVVPKGSGSGLTVAPLAAPDMVSGMRALLMVTHDASFDPAADSTGAAPPGAR